MKPMSTGDAGALALAERLNAQRPAQEVLAHVAWSVLTEPGDSVAGALRATVGAGAALELALSDGEVPGVAPAALSEARGRWMPRADGSLVSDAVRMAMDRGLRLTLPGDAEWPHRLDDLGPHAPAVLWVRGDPAALTRASSAVSLVGARAATAYGEHMARELSGDLAAAGILVVSGGAYGIDGVAHRAALGARGDTIAFLAGGVDRAYPVGHARLFDDIVRSGGAVASEVACGAAPTKWRFLARNRLIGALGDATVVVEAGWRSGSLNTAGHAADLGRPLGAVPGPVTSAASAGCHRLLREYDARCVTSAADVRELLGDVVSEPQPSTPRDHDRVRLCDAMNSRTARTPLDLARRSGLSVERVESLLGMLALEGAAVRAESGWRQVG